MTAALDYRVQLDTVHSGFDGVTCWVQCRLGAIPRPADQPIVVLTMQKLLLSGSDIFYALNELRTDDLGVSWRGPTEHESLGRRSEPGGMEAVICDATPQWHAASKTLLTTGHVARYVGDVLASAPRRRETSYSAYDPEARTWAPWAVLEMPEADTKFFSVGAGSTQRCDLPNGDILLPVYFAPAATAAEGWQGCCSATVLRCRFDGSALRYVEHGDELALAEPRGFCEPSMAQFGGRFFMTFRNDVRGYVASSDDGLHFETPAPWTFDDGTELGNYNTQQHWVTHSDGLFLVYTRRGLDNDHVFRHRAPLVMARVDPERCCVLRDTERVVVPERGARLGNFAVANISENETWISVSEWMQPIGCEEYGSDNSVYVARLLWDRPNTLCFPPQVP